MATMLRVRCVMGLITMRSIRSISTKVATDAISSAGGRSEPALLAVEPLHSPKTASEMMTRPINRTAANLARMVRNTVWSRENVVIDTMGATAE